jgi:2-hydroxychromene-2-carboxylate isomerase
MSLSFDVFWSFRSPYCYLALDRILDLRATHDVEVNVRPVFPLAVRTPDFFKRVHPNYRRYHTLDSHRVAEFLGIPFRRAVPDPIVQDMETSTISPHQPYIFRLTRLGMAAALAGRGLEFLDQVSRLLWDGSVDGWDKGRHLADAVERAGLDLVVLDREIVNDPIRLDTAIEENQNVHVAAGHWGVPTFLFEGEPFYGQDRMDVLVWRMRQKGLAER